MAARREHVNTRDLRRNIEFSGPPQIGGGLGLAGLLKLAGYGDDSNELDQYKLLASIAQHRDEQAFKGRQEEREGRKTESDIGAAQLKSQIDMLNLQRQIAEMQQKGETGQLDALVELAKIGDKTAVAALRKASQPYAQAKAEEQDYANRWEAGKMEAELANEYRQGNKKNIATYMALQNPNFAANPELAKLIDWQKLAQQWPVDPATPRQGVLATGAGPPAPSGEATPWRYGTGTQPIPETSQVYVGGGPSAMPGYIDPKLLQLASQQGPVQALPGVNPALAQGEAGRRAAEAQAPTGAEGGFQYLPGGPSAQPDYNYGIQTPVPGFIQAKYDADPAYMPVEQELLRRAMDWWRGTQTVQSPEPGFEYLPGGPSAMPYVRSTEAALPWLYGNRFQNMNINAPPPVNLGEGAAAAQGLEAPRAPVFGRR